MSFALTTEQFLMKKKDVTRRLGWYFLKPGTLLWGVEKGMGLKKGERIKRLGLIVVVSTRLEPIRAITREDVIREGFPDWSTADFVKFFCKHNGIKPGVQVNRIEFRYAGEEVSREMILNCRKARRVLATRKNL
jgi:hypothetical protein